MSRFLKRITAEDTESAEPTPEPSAVAAVADAPIKPAPRRSGARRRSPTNGSKTEAEVAVSSVRPARRTGRRATKDSNEATETKERSQPAQDPAEKMLSLIERQTMLLEQQSKSIEQLAASQALLTETLLGQRGDDVSPARIEVLPRLAIFVDVPNILYGAEASGVALNWGKVADFLSHGRTLVRAIAYAPISDDPTARTENERFVVPFLDHGYRIATKQLKRFSGGSVKANFDVELAIDVLTMSDRIDVIVLVSGDGDFRRLVEIVGARGVRVEVMAFGKSTSSDLRQVADRYIDIAQYADRLRDD